MVQNTNTGQGSRAGQAQVGRERRIISFLLVLEGCGRLCGFPVSTLTALPPAPSLSEEKWLFAIKTKVLEFRTDTQQFTISSSLILSQEVFPDFWVVVWRLQQWKATRIVEFIINLGRGKWWWGGDWEGIHCPLSFLTQVSLPVPLSVDSPDLLLGMVYDCGTPDGGAVHNSSERCHRRRGEVASWASSLSLYLVRLWGARRTPQDYLLLGRSTERKEVFPFPMSLSIPEEYEIPLSPRLVSHTWPERGNARPFSFFLLPPFSRFPSISFLITHLFLQLALSGFALILLSLFTLLPFLYSPSLLPLSPLLSPALISPFHIALLLSNSPLFPFPTFSSIRYTQLATLWFQKDHDITEADSFPGLGGRNWLSVSAAWLPLCFFTAGPARKGEGEEPALRLLVGFGKSILLTCLKLP